MGMPQLFELPMESAMPLIMISIMRNITLIMSLTASADAGAGVVVVSAQINSRLARLCFMT
jgi:hypothetical protein